LIIFIEKLFKVDSLLALNLYHIRNAMQKTKNFLLTMLIIGSTGNMISESNDQSNDGLVKEDKSMMNACNNLKPMVLSEALKLLQPLDDSFDAAEQAFAKFNKEKVTNTVLSVARTFFSNESEYCKALGNCAENQKFSHLAGFFYRQASESSSVHQSELLVDLRKLGVLRMVHILNSLDIPKDLVLDQKAFFTKKDINGKSCLDEANAIYALTGFKSSEFIQAIFDYQKAIGGRLEVVNMFSQHWTPKK
jgi:hypothetical protein